MEFEFSDLDKIDEEVKWLQNLLEDIWFWPKSVWLICIYHDSQVIICGPKSIIYNKNSYHIWERHYIVRQLLSSRIITIVYVKSRDDVLDPLTKDLVREVVE